MRQMIFKVTLLLAAPIAIVLSVAAISTLLFISYDGVESTAVKTPKAEPYFNTLNATQVRDLSVYRDHTYN